jgi:hypothetical protein
LQILTIKNIFMDKITLFFFQAKSKTTIKRLLLLVAILLLNNQVSWGQVNIAAGTTITENFDGIGATATATLPSAWKIENITGARTVANAYSAVANVATTSALTHNIAMPTNASNGRYNFGGSSSSDRAIGGISSSSASQSINMFVQLTNNGATEIKDFNINYAAEKYRNGTNAAGFSIRVYYSTTGNANSWTEIPGLIATFAGTNVDNAGSTTNPMQTINITNKTLSQSLAAGGSIYLVWNYSVTTGTTTSNAQALGIDNISITANASTSTTWTTAWSNGPPTASLDAIIAGPYSVAANITAKTLTVNNNAVVTIPSGNIVTVTDAVTVTAPATFTLSNDASLIQVNNVSNSGAITVNRNSNPLLRLDYTLWSSPVVGQSLVAFSPLTSQSPSRFYTFDTTFNTAGVNGSYAVITNPTNTLFTAGAGYLIRMPNTANAVTPTAYAGQFTGVPNNGNIPVSLVFGANAGLRFNLVGNPYPSTINLFTLRNDNSSVIGNTFYMWRKTNGVGTAYCSYVPTTTTSGTYVSNSNAQSPTNFVGDIQTGQGFFVSALSTGPLVFKNGQRGTTPTSFFKTKQPVESSKVWLNATNLDGNFSQMAVTYFDGATPDIDDFDGRYINDSAFALTSNINNGEYTIQSRPAFDVADIVPLNFKTELDGNYTIAIDHSEGVFAAGQDIYLVDSKTGAETNLKTSLYNFTATSGIDNTRFLLKYQKTLKVDAPEFNENSVYAYISNGTLYVNSGNSVINTIQVYDVEGRLIAERKNVKAATAILENLKANNQLLLVKVVGENNEMVTKKIVH